MKTHNIIINIIKILYINILCLYYWKQLLIFQHNIKSDWKQKYRIGDMYSLNIHRN